MDKKNIKIGLIALILTIAVGFAAVTTNILMNGQTTIGTNQDDFDVRFINGYVSENTQEHSNMGVQLSNDGKGLYIFTSSISDQGAVAEFTYTIRNASKNYDAKVLLSYENVTSYGNSMPNGDENFDYSKYINLELIGFDNDENSIIPAGGIKQGKIRITLINPPIEDYMFRLTLKLDATPQERTSLGNTESNGMKYYKSSYDSHYDIPLETEPTEGAFFASPTYDGQRDQSSERNIVYLNPKYGNVTIPYDVDKAAEVMLDYIKLDKETWTKTVDEKGFTTYTNPDGDIKYIEEVEYKDGNRTVSPKKQYIIIGEYSFIQRPNDKSYNISGPYSFIEIERQQVIEG